jgi:hypothetical protein
MGRTDGLEPADEAQFDINDLSHHVAAVGLTERRFTMEFAAELQSTQG